MPIEERTFISPFDPPLMVRGNCTPFDSLIPIKGWRFCFKHKNGSALPILALCPVPDGDHVPDADSPDSDADASVSAETVAAALVSAPDYTPDDNHATVLLAVLEPAAGAVAIVTVVAAGAVVAATVATVAVVPAAENPIVPVVASASCRDHRDIGHPCRSAQSLPRDLFCVVFHKWKDTASFLTHKILQ